MTDLRILNHIGETSMNDGEHIGRTLYISKSDRVNRVGEGYNWHDVSM